MIVGESEICSVRILLGIGFYCAGGALRKMISGINSIEKKNLFALTFYTRKRNISYTYSVYRIYVYGMGLFHSSIIHEAKRSVIRIIKKRRSIAIPVYIV